MLTHKFYLIFRSSSVLLCLRNSSKALAPSLPNPLYDKSSVRKKMFPFKINNTPSEVQESTFQSRKDFWMKWRLLLNLQSMSWKLSEGIWRREDIISLTSRPFANAMAPFPRMQFQARLSDFIPVFSAMAAPRISPEERDEEKESVMLKTVFIIDNYSKKSFVCLLCALFVMCFRSHLADHRVTGGDVPCSRAQ